MPDYSKVQFIAWEIYTGPVYGPWGADHYPGLAPAAGDRCFNALSQCLDIIARVEFTRRAIETAYQNVKEDPETLKVFMAPEFLYRGAAGAYLYDLLNGWVKAPDSFGQLPPSLKGPWGGLFGELRALVADERFQNWIFIFGSAVGVGFPQTSAASIDPFSPLAAGINMALIQCGGSTQQQRNACYFTEKHLQSGVDFVDFNLMNPGLRVLTDADITHGSEPTWKILDRLIQENPNGYGGSLFRFPHIRRSGGKVIQFGLEICLDHSVGYVTANGKASKTGRLAAGAALVDIQLVPSCGMSLIKTSLALGPQTGPRNFSYAFNCDGLQSRDPGRPGLSTHIQLWNELGDKESYQVNEVAAIKDGYIEAGHIPVDDTAVDLSTLNLPPDALRALGIDIQSISANQLWYSHEPFKVGEDDHETFWPEGPGFIRLLDPQLLAEAPAPPTNAAEPPSPRTESAAKALMALPSGKRN